MGLLNLCVTFLTLLVWRHLVYSTGRMQTLLLASAGEKLIFNRLNRVHLTSPSIIAFILHFTLISISCPSGDTSGIVKNGNTCSQLIPSANYQCYDAAIETSCCSSCNAIATGISGCQYGDRVESCTLGVCPYYTNLSDCCFTCRITTTIETMTTTMTPSPAENTTSSPSQSPSAATTTPSSAGNNTTSSFIQSVSTTTTTTITSSTAENNITNFALQLSSSQSSAGVIAGSVVGSLAGTGLIAVVTYAGVQFFKSTKLRRVDIA